MDLALRGKVAWITGATGAIGRAVARALLAEGVETVLSARNAASLEALAGELSNSGPARAHAMPLDVTTRAAVDAAAKRIAVDCGRIDILVNSTTLPVFGDFPELMDEDWEIVIQTKYLGYMRCIRAVLPYMQHQGGGAIVNITGRGGHQPSPAHLPGSSVNAAVNTLTKGLADLHGKDNIRINAIAPGPIQSERLDRLMEKSREVQERGAAGYRSKTPIARLGRPQDVADAALYLISERAGFVTGTVMQVDGGGTATV